VATKHEIMTLPEVAEYLGVSERTIYDWAQKRKIPAAKLGNAWRFKRSVLDRWKLERDRKK
jgi:PTS system nitrogen regulatory IIA component